MHAKHIEKEKAIALRRLGKTYSQILSEVPVAKSTLSLWLREVGLAIPQQQIITEAKKAAQCKAASARRIQRITHTQNIYEKSTQEVGELSKRELWLIGVALYWAEGAKQKAWDVSVRFQFCNSDPDMIILFLRWATLIGISFDRLDFRLSIHDSAKHRIDEVLQYWADLVGTSRTKLHFKHHKINTKRHNTGDLYRGVLQVSITRSTDLNRRVTGWIKGMCRI